MANFDGDFLTKVRSDPLGALLEISRRVNEMLENSGSPDWSEGEVEYVVEAYALICEMINAGLIDESDPQISVDDVPDKVGPAITQFISGLRSKYEGKHKVGELNRMRARFAIGLGSAITYEFTSGDLERVQRLITETREAIRACDAFDEKHRRRLLMRLEKLQAEVHKKMSDVDMFWGLMGDAGVALGKFGEDVKPVVDRIRELFSIAWQAQSRAEELPSNEPAPRIEYKSGTRE